MMLVRATFVLPVQMPAGTTMRSEMRVDDGLGAVHALELVSMLGAAMVLARQGEHVAYYPLSACARLAPALPAGVSAGRDEELQAADPPLNRAARRAAR